MPIIKTQEELLASKIKPRNSSSVLSAIYFLKHRVAADYVPSAPSRIIWGASDIGVNDGTLGIFTVLSPTSYVKGNPITLAGTATYLLTSGASTTTPKKAIRIVAQIDIGNRDSGFPARQIEALTATEINNDGTFSFVIPASVTNAMAAGKHTVYLDASSPAGATRLGVFTTLTGTANPTASTTLVGSGTLFTTQLVVGDIITINTETRTVTAIASATSLTVNAAFTDTASASVTKLTTSNGVVGVQTFDITLS